ncbi:MAG: glycoside hydrolase, partial [Actinobacteria bacterium]|nr:glycoside hydrolase [Actinomycetota bacterium]
FSGSCGVTIYPPLDQSRFYPPNTAVEPSVAVNPRNPDNIVVAWIQDFPQDNVLAITSDGGRTWQRRAVPKLTQCDGGENQATADPWLSFGPDGVVYLSSMGIDLPPGSFTPVNTVVVSHSKDGGDTWSDPVVVHGRDAYNDEPTILADPGRAGRVHVFWSLRYALGAETVADFHSVSNDGGKTWSAASAAYVPQGAGLVPLGAQIVATPDGTLLYSFLLNNAANYLSPLPTLVDAEARVIRSTDHGQTWSQPIGVGSGSAATNPPGLLASAS